QLPIMLFTLIGGVLADRRDRRHTLLTSQYIQMTTATVLAVLVFFDLVKIWQILVLSFMTGLAQAFGGPAYQALIPSLVNNKDLVSLTVLAAATTFLGFATITFLPLFTQQVFHEGASTYSRLLAFSGAGSIVGALVVAWLGKFAKMGWTTLMVQAVYGLLMV